MSDWPATVTEGRDGRGWSVDLWQLCSCMLASSAEADCPLRGGRCTKGASSDKVGN